MRHERLLSSALLLALLCFSGLAHAAIVLITDPAQLRANDQLGWTSLGPPGTVISSPFQLQTDHGIAVTVKTGGTPPSFKRLDQGNGFSGDFAPGTPLLATNSLGPLTIDFPTPVYGVGAFVEHATLDTFTQYIRANAGKNVLAEFTVDETNNHLGNGTAGFIGVLSDQADITEISFDSFRGGNTVSSAVFILAPQPAPVPLPAPLLMISLALPTVWLVGRALDPIN
jgi:hypothetical protein